MKKLICSFSMFACVAGIMLSCSNPTDPADSSPTMWYKVVSPAGLPDTLYYGQSVTFQIAIGDSDGDPVSATLSGLPAGSYNITANGDTTFVTMNLVADSLQFDSLYSVRVSAKGGAGVDSLPLAYSLMVIDSTRLGGVKKLITGMWWTETGGDTALTMRDSASTTFITRDTVLHQKYSKVLIASVSGSDMVYIIETNDTSYADTGKGLSKSYMQLRHSASGVEYVLPPMGGFTDSIRIKMYGLPLAVNNSWQYIHSSGDTTVTIPFFIVNLKLLIAFEIDGTSQIPSLSGYSFGGSERPCFQIANASTWKTAMVCDSTISILTVTVNKGDTISASTTKSTGSMLVNTEISLPLSSFTVEEKVDTNYFDGVVERGTTRKGSFITALYDARKDVTLTK